MTSGMVPVLIGMLIFAITITLVFRLSGGEWFWSSLAAWMQGRVDRRITEAAIAKREQITHVQELEHELGILPHADPEYLCRTCQRQNTGTVIYDTAADRTYVSDADSWVEITGFGSAQSTYVGGGWTPPPFPEALPEVIKK